MSDSLKDILNRKNRSEPEEITLIKKYVQDQYNKTVGVKTSKDNIRIETNNAALAGELRFKVYEIKRLVKTDKNLIIRIV